MLLVSLGRIPSKDSRARNLEQATFGRTKPTKSVEKVNSLDPKLKGKDTIAYQENRD